MKRKSVFNLSKILVFALLPYLSVSVINGSERILLNYRPDSEVYLTAVLSCQISPDYELQTVEAQAVIARSNLFRKFAEEENRLDVLREMGKSIKNQWKWWISDEIYEDAVENTDGKFCLWMENWILFHITRSVVARPETGRLCLEVQSINI